MQTRMQTTAAALDQNNTLLRKKTSINENGEEIEPDYCPICYDNEIQLAPKEITDEMTF